MFFTFLDKIGGLFDRRFLLAFWMPVLVCGCMIGGTWFALSGTTAALKWWDHESVTLTTLLGAIALFATTLFAFLLQSFSTLLLRLYVGYWPVKWLESWGQTKQTARRAVSERGKVADRYFDYSRTSARTTPQPTRLGNILTAAYDYPKEVYGVDATIWWSRLSALLPADFRAQVDNAFTPLLALVNLCTLLVVATFGSSVLITFMSQRWRLLVALMLGGALLARLCYNAACSQAMGYGDQLRVAFDLYRGELIKQMRLPLPKSPWEERSNFWNILNAWIYRYQPPWEFPKNHPLTEWFSYDNPSEEPVGEEMTISFRGTPWATMVRKQAEKTPASGQPGAALEDELRTERGAANESIRPEIAPSATVAAKGMTNAQVLRKSIGDWWASSNAKTIKDWIQSWWVATKNARDRIHRKWSNSKIKKAKDRTQRAWKVLAGAVNDWATRRSLAAEKSFWSWTCRRSMAWLVLFLLIVVGGSEIWWMKHGTLIKAVNINHDLPALGVVAVADLNETTTRTANPKLITSVDEAIGRITLNAIPAGSLLDSTMLSMSRPSVPAADLQGRQVFSLSADSAPNLLVGEHALLLGIESDGDPAKETVKTLTSDAVSLGMQEGRLLLALPANDSYELARYLLTQKRFLVLRKLDTGPSAPTSSSMPK